MLLNEQQYPSPRLSPLPGSLGTAGASGSGGSSLALPLPSPALSDGGGFAAFDPSPLPSSAFNFDRHFAETIAGNQFDDLEDPNSPAATDPELNPPPSLQSADTFPPSPSSLIASTSSQVDGFSDYSPSPSIASVRMAQLVTRMPARRALEEPARLSVATSQSMSSSLRLSVAETDDDEEAVVWDAQRFSKRPVPVRRTTTDLFGQGGQQRTELSQPADQAVTPPAVASPRVPDALVKSSSEGSGSGSLADQSAATLEAPHEEADPAISPAADAMGRMKSILGPKVKKISAAPWDMDSSASSSDSLAPPPKVRARSSMDALRNVASAGSRPLKAPTKEKDKPLKSNGRSKSFSMLTSRKASSSEADIKASEEALKGLGLGKVESLTVFGAKIPSVPAGHSFLELTVDPATRKPKSTPPLGEQAAFAFPTPPSKSPSPTKARKSFGSSSIRARPPPPIHFDPSGSAQPSSPSAIPRSAPPHMSSFAAVPRSDSVASLGVHPPRPSTSGYSLANSANSSSPSTPTGHPTAFASSPTSPTGSYFGPGSTATSPTGPGYKLISLDEARERESQRIAAAVARRERAMTPVEHVAGREEVLYGGVSKERTRQSTADSSRGRAASGPASSTSTTPAYTPSPSSSTLAQQAPPIKTLKPKKSGFLRRMMMGGAADKSTAEAARSESPAPSSLATSPPYSVTISSPRVSVDLGRSQAASSAVAVSGLTSSPSFASTAPSARISFMTTPVPNLEHRLRKGLAPSLSLRPISMAFSAGLPSDFLADVAAADANTLSLNLPSPISSAPLPLPISINDRPTSPSDSVQSPFAPSFASSTTGGRSSLFDKDENPSSTATTPVTPAFPSFSAVALGSPTSPVFGSLSHAALQAEFVKAKALWQHQQWELETQVKILQAELNQSRTKSAECSTCGAALGSSPTPSPSIVERPRFKGHGGSGGLYGSSLVA